MSSYLHGHRKTWPKDIEGLILCFTGITTQPKKGITRMQYCFCCQHESWFNVKGFFLSFIVSIYYPPCLFGKLEIIVRTLLLYWGNASNRIARRSLPQTAISKETSRDKMNDSIKELNQKTEKAARWQTCNFVITSRALLVYLMKSSDAKPMEGSVSFWFWAQTRSCVRLVAC